MNFTCVILNNFLMVFFPLFSGKNVKIHFGFGMMFTNPFLQDLKSSGSKQIHNTD
jgi:hypothetical protein